MVFVLPFLQRVNHEGAETETGRSFKLTYAVAIASMMALMSLLAAWLQHAFGDVGVLVVALFVAWVEVQAAAASVAQLVQTGGMAPDLAHWALVAILASSALAKTALAMASGGARYGLTVGFGLLTMVAGGAAGVWWFT